MTLVSGRPRPGPGPGARALPGPLRATPAGAGGPSGLPRLRRPDYDGHDPADQKSDRFIADLKPERFEIYEDGVKQEIASFDARARWPRLQPDRAAAGAGAGRHHPAAQPAD